MNSGGGEGIAVAVVLVVYLAIFALVIAAIALALWAVIDAARRPDWQFEAAGQNKTLWIVLPAAGAAMCQLLGLVAALVYLLSIRKKLQAALPPQSGYGGYGGPVSMPPPGWPGGPGGPPPGWPGGPGGPPPGH